MPMFAWALVLMVASHVITGLLTKKPRVAPQSESEVDFPQEEEGTAQAWLFGDGWTKGFQCVWHGNFRTVKIKAKGGKK